MFSKRGLITFFNFLYKYIYVFCGIFIQNFYKLVLFAEYYLGEQHCFWFLLGYNTLQIFTIENCYTIFIKKKHYRRHKKRHNKYWDNIYLGIPMITAYRMWCGGQCKRRVFSSVAFCWVFCFWGSRRLHLFFWRFEGKTKRGKTKRSGLQLTMRFTRFNIWHIRNRIDSWNTLYLFICKQALN